MNLLSDRDKKWLPPERVAAEKQLISFRTV